MIALVDCNNFYASAERLFCPRVLKAPVVVLSNNDGCVIARSEQAKVLGIKMGAPAFLMEKQLTENNVEVFSSNYTLYNSISDRVHATISKFVMDWEKYSIDESFIDLSGYYGMNPYRYCKLIRATVFRNVGIPVSIGIAPTRTLAKMANRYAKKERRHIGVFMLDTPAKTEMVLKYTKVEDVWGIGRQFSAFLNSHGVITAWDLIQMPQAWIRKNMSVVGLRLVTELKGIPCAELETEPAIKKNIGIAKSFGSLLSRREDVAAALGNYVTAAAEKLRAQKSCCSRIQVFIQTNGFRTQDRQYFRSITIQLPVATSFTPELLNYADIALSRIWKDSYNYKKVGIFLENLVDRDKVQLGLYDTKDREKQRKLMTAVDSINKAFNGKELVKFGRQGAGGRWSLRRQRLSPCYTTRLSEVLVIKY
ncbi:Y-family DNA polymerase [Chitinophaga polysaccharea]|uniref:Y-family DNA polymerase n=1 Tax=Chitinophaga polysaccharea TaxID=1293035 RepID=UPI001455C5D8|nr:Y-family DNA polymerase [Chitinophaga polysaccharea]NLR60719.1 Y-family DNA polymerase [Chitinophaga polysaccharea]